MARLPFALGTKSRPNSVQAYRQAAERALPKMIWSYLDSGADDHITLDANEAAFRRWRLRPRALAGITSPTLATTMAGTEIALPVALAPVGLTGLFRWDGDVAAARAAEAEGTRLVLSTGSSWSLEEVAEATQQNHWFQLYPYGDRAKVAQLVARAASTGYSALFVTVDVPIRGNRERERAAGMEMPIQITPRSALDFVRHPRWCWETLRQGRTVAIHYAQVGARGVTAAADSVAEQDRHMQGDLCWDDLAWLRDRWQGKLYVKGVLDPEDAVRSVDTIGAEGVVVSNHGGRQLDRVPAALEALPGIVEALGGRGEVYLDGGVRRGSDVITALALGAKAVLVGRAYSYGLAADGERGTRHVLAILREDLRRTLILMGCPGVAALDRSWLLPAP